MGYYLEEEMNAISKNTIRNPHDFMAAVAIVDKLGKLKAKIADITAQETVLKDELKTLGDGVYEGELFRATVSTHDKNYLDMDAVRDKLSPQFIKAHTSTTETTVVKVVARTRK